MKARRRAGRGDAPQRPLRAGPHRLSDALRRFIDGLGQPRERAGGLWRFFAEVGDPAPERALPPEVRIPADLAQIVARYDGNVLGPPLNR